MRHIFIVPLATLALAIATQAQAGERPRYLELINRAHDSVTSVAVAPAGVDAFREMPLGGALRGGGGSTTIEIADETCRYDLRLQFRNGRTVIYRDFNVCRNGSLRIGKLPRADDADGAAAEQLLARRFER
jgi:hypothetical protein